MNKKAIVIVEDGLITKVLELKTFTSELDFKKICDTAAQNERAHSEALRKQTELKDAFHKANSHKQDLLISYLTNEIKLLKGEISDEEYEEINRNTSSLLEECESRLQQLESEARKYGLD